MPEKEESERLRDEQARREQIERERAAETPEPAERAQHERRSEKADYLREKLEEQADAPDQSHDS